MNVLISYSIIAIFFIFMESPLWANKDLDDLPLEVRRSIFLHLDTSDLVSASIVSKKWQEAVNQREIWTDACKMMSVGLFQGKDETNFSLEEAKEHAKKHYLAVLVNTKDTPEQIYHLVHHYQLESFLPEIFHYLFDQLARHFKLSFPEKKELCAQGRGEVIGALMSPSKEDREYIYPEEAKVARDINDWLVLQDDEEAINRQIEGAIYGWHGYESKGFNRAQELIEHFVEKGSSVAIMHKIRGYTMGYTGYKVDYIAGQKLIDFCIEKGNEEALFYKADSLFYGKYGYKKNLRAARELYTLIVQQGGKHSALASMRLEIYTNKDSSKTPPNSKKLIVDEFARQRTSSIEKINGMERERNPLGYYLKALGMKYGVFGFQKDRDFSRIYIKEHGIPY